MNWFPDILEESVNGFWSSLSCGSKAGRGYAPSCEDQPETTPDAGPAWGPGEARARGQKELERYRRPTAQKGIAAAFSPYVSMWAD